MVEYNDLRASAYNLACGFDKEDIADMARKFEQSLIINGNVTLSIIKQKKAEKMRLSKQKDSSRLDRVSGGAVLYEKGTDMPPYVFRLMNVLPLSDVREIRYSGDELSIISGIEQKTYKIETKKGRVVGIKFKKKVLVEK